MTMVNPDSSRAAGGQPSPAASVLPNEIHEPTEEARRNDRADGNDGEGPGGGSNGKAAPNGGT